MPAPRSPVSMWRRQAAIALAVLMAGCNSGSSNPAGPSTTRQNLPSLGNQPAVPTGNASAKRIKLTGKIVNATTGEPLEKVNVLLVSEPAAQPPASPTASVTPPGSNPAAMPKPGGSAVSATPSSTTAATPAPIAPGAVPLSDAKPESFVTTTNNEGKFFFNGIPEGTMSLSLTAPKYRAITLYNVDGAKMEGIALNERNDAPRRSVKGTVTSATGQPMAGAFVSPIFRPGQGFPTFVSSDDKGQFLLDDVTSIPKGFAAIGQGPKGQITSFSVLQAGDTKLEQKSWLDRLFGTKTSEAKADAPVKLVTRAVTETVDVVADIEKSDEATGYTAKDAAVLMTMTDKGDEALILRDRVTGDRLRYSLPQLPGGASYHLRVRGVGPHDASSFHHVYGLHGAEKETKIAFLAAPSNAKGVFVKSDAGPTFSWDTVGGADAYRVQLDKADGETLWQGWTTETSLTYPTGKGFEKLRDKDSYVWSVSAIKGLKGGGKIDAAAVDDAQWTDLSTTPNLDLDFTGMASGGRRKPSAKPHSLRTQSEKPKPGAKVSDKPGAAKTGAATKPEVGSKPDTSAKPGASPAPSVRTPAGKGSDSKAMGMPATPAAAIPNQALDDVVPESTQPSSKPASTPI
jgi:hypothetical protein